MKAEKTACKKCMWPILWGREKEKRAGRIKREWSEKKERLSVFPKRDVAIETVVVLSCLCIFSLCVLQMLHSYLHACVFVFCLIVVLRLVTDECCLCIVYVCLFCGYCLCARPGSRLRASAVQLKWRHHWVSWRKGNKTEQWLLCYLSFITIKSCVPQEVHSPKSPPNTHTHIHLAFISSSPHHS